MRPLVILHGWSDFDEEFIPMANTLANRNNRLVQNLWLGEYVTLDDSVYMTDIVDGLHQAWITSKENTGLDSFDVIVHSTAALVVRDWLFTKFFSENKPSPIKNLIMLAPANFGSPLAHIGRAMHGRIFKGWNSDKRFETGKHILKNLEIASPYSWDLALKDRIHNNFYGADGIRTTVIIGNAGYTGVKSMANKKGSDGTIYVSTANLNCEYIELDFSSDPSAPRISQRKRPESEIAFLVADKHHHSSIALKEDPDEFDNESIIKAINHALDIETEEQFGRWVSTCEAENKRLHDSYKNSGKKYFHGYQNTIFHVIDDAGNEIEDYVIEFYQDIEKGIGDRLATLFYDKSVEKVHAYKSNNSYRSFLINCTELHQVIDEVNESLRISLSVLPDYREEHNVVGYDSWGDNMHYIELDPEGVKEFFQPNRTLMVEIVIKRERKNSLVTLRSKQDVIDDPDP